MKTNLSDSIIKTLVYADIFDYPLHLSELHRFLISGKKYSEKEIVGELKLLGHLIDFAQSLYYLRGKKSILRARRARKRYSLRKMKKAKTVARILSYIPTILLIGISGSLAMNNCKKNDDIDFFFITKKNTLWISRGIVVMLLFIFGLKRGRTETFGTDKICPNMFMSEDHLSLPRHNLFIAHELIQLKVLIDKKNAYERLLSSNLWIYRYLANISSEIIPFRNKDTFSLSAILLWPLEKIAYASQLFYMRTHRTQEFISPKIASFHPIDKTSFILMLFKEKCKFIFKFIERKGALVKMKKSQFLRLKSHHNRQFLIDTLGY